MTDAERGATALALWREWFKEDGYPWWPDGPDGDRCFFCQELKEVRGHAPDCIYIRARKLTEEDTNGQ